MKRCFGLLTLILIGRIAVAQDQLIDNLQQQYHQYQSNNLQEKIFVHTDKTFYLAGENVWFKLYSVDASFHKPGQFGSIAYLEILTRDQKPVAQTKVPLQQSCANGSINIPASLPTGNYILRAYTSWMKNFSSDFYYEQTLHIVNTLKLTTAATVTKTFPTIQFFPEGGTGLNGFMGKIAFLAADANGHGLDCRGAIVNDKSDTVARFQSVHNGMGNFMLKPEKTNSYYALVYLNDSLIKVKLPDAKNNGLSMAINTDESGNWKIDIHATPDLNNTKIYLLAHTRQVIKKVQTGIVNDGVAQFTIDKKDLGDGISALTIFNSSRQPECERLVFKRPQESLVIDTRADQSIYEPRTLVKINLTTVNNIEKPLNGNLSMSVFMIDSLQHVPEQSIVHYLYLSSDIKGHIQDPEYYFTHTDASSNEALDNLLLTQGWRRFKWNDVFDFRKPAFEFLPELEGPVINGKIINKINGTPVAASGAYLSIPGNDNAFSSATSDARGQIRFGYRDVYKNNVLVVQPALLKDSGYRIDITSAYSDRFSSSPQPAFLLSKNQETILLNRSIGNQVENTFNIDKKHQYINAVTDTTSFYGKPDRMYNLDEYTRFQTMEEVMREFVEDVRVRKDGDHFNFKVRNRLFGTYFEEDPLILLDGIPISDATKIIALDPLKIKKIEVVMHNYYIGSSLFQGIINVKSYSGEMGATQIDPNAIVVEYEGLQQQREFYSPVYDSHTAQDNHMPDFRNVLYWAPQIQTGAGGKANLQFYTSDIKGKFAIVTQGITSEGLPGKSVTLFEVR